jgi:hypothetical protein
LNSNFECTDEIPSDDSTSDTEGIIAKAVLAAGVAISTTASFATMASPQGTFSMLNLFQLYILLPMIGPYIPPRVVDFITGMSFTMFSFSFIPFEKVPLITTIFNFIDYDQSDDYFDNIGLTSGSAFLNHIALLIIIGVMILYHLALLP